MHRQVHVWPRVQHLLQSVGLLEVNGGLAAVSNAMGNAIKIQKNNAYAVSLAPGAATLQSIG